MPKPLPLEGVRILAVSSFGAGPWATMLLADLGADVIKIEDHNTGGDASRVVPPRTPGVDDDTLYFQSLNRNKRSITLNLRSAEGQEVFHALVRGSDAVYNNMRGDLPGKLGLDYGALGSVNPGIVCASCSGYGVRTSKAAEPGYDFLMQGMTGYMALTGEPDAPPARCGVSVVDFASGLISVVGLLAGLERRRRTGLGGDFDTSLYEGALSMLNYLAVLNLNLGFKPAKLPHSAHQTLVPVQNFPTRDGWLVIMCMKEKFFPLLCEALGRPDLPADPRFEDLSARYENRSELVEILCAELRKETTEAWMGRLRGKVPAAPVYELDEALRQPFVEELGMLWEIDHPRLGRIREVGCPLDLPDTEPLPRRPASALGADTDTVLAEVAGLSEERIRELHEKGII